MSARPHARRTGGRRSAPLVALGAVALAFAFGAADQYLGSLLGHPWAADVSLLSAPWLLLPFLAGWTQGEQGRAALLGLACTFSALLGYALMTLSPVEGAALTVQGIRGFAVSSERVLVGGLLTGPLFGWLGHRWRKDRAWYGAVAVAGAVCLEPLARASAGEAIRFRAVWLAEVVVGIAMLVYVGAVVLAQARRRDPA